MDNRERLIVALDVASPDEGLVWANKLKGKVGVFKVGLQLFTAGGPKLVKDMQATGAKIFLDLKFHDIPNTVAKAVEQAVALKVEMVTLHTSGGSEMMKAAVQARGKAKKPLLLGVTVLTSLHPEVLKQELFVAQSLPDQVVSLAKLAQQSGLDGVVASAQEASLIRQACGKEFLIVTPGIRLPENKVQDQKRVLGPKQALEAGADYLVVGRPILGVENPVAAADKMVEEMSKS